MDGLYIYSFFHMKIDSTSFGDGMSDKELSFFIHEYIHYLQNITTICGLERLNSDFVVLCRKIDWIKEQDDINVFVPILDEILKEPTLSNKLLIDLISGDTDFIEDFKFISTEIFDITKIDNLRNIESVILNFKNGYGIEDNRLFGAREISESMAYLIEQHITKDYNSSPAYPYKTASMVVGYFCPELLKDYRNILIICDKALMSSNPGAEFFHIAQWLGQIKYIPSSPEELFQFLVINWQFYDLGEKTSSMDYYLSRAEEVRNNLHVLLKDEFFNDYNKWVDQIIDFAIFLRKKEPMFWLKLVEHGYVKNNQVWKEIINNIGGPVIEIDKHIYYNINPICCNSSCILYFEVFYQIYNLLNYGRTSCCLIPLCSSKNTTISVDSSCTICPWNHPDYNGKLCMFKGIWQHWGLNKYNILPR